MFIIILNLFFQCRIKKPRILLIIHFCVRDTVETSEVTKQSKVEAVMFLTDQREGKESNTTHLLVY